MQHNPWLASKYQPSAYDAPRGRPHNGNPYPSTPAPQTADSDWPRHGQDFGGWGSHWDGDGGGGGDEGFGEGGFGERHFVGGFGNLPPEEDETSPVIPPIPRGPAHSRSQSHSPGFTASGIPSFGQAPPQGYGHTPPSGYGHTPPSGHLGLSPGRDAWGKRHSASGTPYTSPMPLSQHHGYAAGPRNQYKRPGDWRRDFTMPKKVGMSEKLGLTRVLSIGKVFSGDCERLTLFLTIESFCR
jgi:hypothetical protein